MATLARADLETLLRARKLDRTLTSALPVPAALDEAALAPTGIAALEAALGGGFPRGQLSELVGPASSGRTSVLLHSLAAATARGELVALVDALDTFDVESAALAGVDLDRLLWVRGHVTAHPGLCRDVNARALEQVLRSLSLILQSGHFGLVVFDVAGVPADALKRLPFTTWLRLQRMVEGSQTSCVLVGGEGMARSSAGVTVHLSPARQPLCRGEASLSAEAFAKAEDSRAAGGSKAPPLQRQEAPPLHVRDVPPLRAGGSKAPPLHSQSLPSHARLVGGLAFDVRVARARTHGADGRQWAVETRMVEQSDVQPLRRAVSARAR